MKTFIKATCGCIVIPTTEPAKLSNHTTCIVLYACDSTYPEDPYSFSFRQIETKKLENGEELDQEKIEAVVNQISVRVAMGVSAREVTRELSFISGNKTYSSDRPY